MGRRIEHNRKISSDRVRKVRKQKNKILIAAEGKNKTEKTYFSNFENGKKPYNITYASGAFSSTLMNINEAKSGTTYSDSGWVKPIEYTASFPNRNINFNQNFNKVINTDTYYLYYGYNHSTVIANEDKVSLSDRYNYTPA